MTISINLKDLKAHQSVIALPEYGCVIVTGEDASTFLQGQLTCDITTLKLNVANRGSICTHKGRMIASFYIHPRKDGFWLIMPRNNIDNLLEHIGKFAAFSKVTLKDVSDNWHVMGLIGGTAAPSENISLILPDDLNRAFCLTQSPDAHSQQSTLWHGLNVLANIADIDANTKESFTPQMIDLQKFDGVSFTKGCYVGQEVVARTEHLGKLKRHLRYLQLPLDHANETGSAVKNDQDETMGIVAESYLDNESLHVLAVVEDRLFVPQ
ncbi:MAG: hypothetical protein K0U23_07910 [Gammaproteobacteria bacterium]|nr:hypothetical protein [Gammaproteobacteria bacterium]